MLSESGSGVKFPQATFACHVCGIVETKTGPNQKCCKVCRPERWRQYYRDYHGRRARRGKRALGDMVACEKCHAKFAIRHSKAKFCKDCTKPKRVNVAAIGSTFGCANCGVLVVKKSRRQCYCDGCFQLREKNVLPAYKAAKSAAASLRYQTDPVYRVRRNRAVLKAQNLKYATDVTFAINVRMRTGIGASLLGQKGGRRWETLVGYRLSDLMLHLERQFLDGMSWDNRGEWHIDHIHPLSMFVFQTAEDPEFHAAWALTNLRPLWGSDNLSKWSHRTLLI